jgi:hypothetical protein
MTELLYQTDAYLKEFTAASPPPRAGRWRLIAWLCTPPAAGSRTTPSRSARRAYLASDRGAQAGRCCLAHIAGRWAAGYRRGGARHSRLGAPPQAE